MPASLAAGLCSVTLRRMSVPAVVQVAVAAGLSCVEWGADLHVRPGDTEGARQARDLAGERGLRVASYGSYFRAGPHAAADFAPVLASADALGAPRIRIWAGDTGSAAATPDQVRATVAAARGVAERAADAGRTIAFEYHGGTLTDTAESTLRLLADVDHPAVGTYWQPRVGAPDAAALGDLERVLPRVVAVHVFSWWPGEERLALDGREQLWRGVLARLRSAGRPFDALLEFVQGDEPVRVETDGAALLRLVRDGASA